MFIQKYKLKAAQILVIFSLLLMATAPMAAAAPNQNSGPAPSPSSTPQVCSDTGASCEDPAIKCTSGNCDIVGKYVNPAINVLALIFGSIAVISLILGGIQYSSSGGDPQKVSAAKKRVFNTIVAVVAFLFLYSFLQFLVPGGIFNK